MKKIIPGLLISLICISCNKEKPAGRLLPEPDQYKQNSGENTIHENKNTVR